MDKVDILESYNRSRDMLTSEIEDVEAQLVYLKEKLNVVVKAIENIETELVGK